MAQYTLAAFVTSLLFSSVGVFIFFCNRKSKISRIFCLYSLSIAGWSFFAGIHSLVPSQTTSFVSARIMHVFVPLIPILFLHFCIIISDQYQKKKRQLFIGYVLSIVFITLSLFTPLMIPNVEPKLGYYFFMNGGTLYPLLILFFVCYTTLGLYHLWKAYLVASGNKKTQLKYLFIGSLIGYCFGTTNFFPVYNITVFPYPYASYAIALYMFITAYAIKKHQLLDIRIVAVKTLAFLLVYVPILTIPFVIAIKGKTLLESYLNDYWWVVPLVILTIFAPVGLRVYQHLKIRAERIIRHKKLKYLQAISDFLEDVKTVRGLNELIDLVLTKTTELVGVNYTGLYLFDREEGVFFLKGDRRTETTSDLKVETAIPKDNALMRMSEKEGKPIIREEINFKMAGSASVFLKEVESEMNRINASVLIPSFYHKNLIAVIVLGEPISNEPYAEEDVEAFNNLGFNVGLAIKTAMFIEEMNNAQAEMLRTNAKKQLSDMADGISHQFHNRFQGITMPIGTARTMIELVNKESLDDKDKNLLNTALDMIDKAEDSAMKGGNIARGILRFTRPEKEGYKMLSVAVGFDTALEMVEYKHSNFGALEITKNIAPDLPSTWANMAYLQDMFFIILDNAYDAINKKMEIEESKTLNGTIDISILPTKDKKQIVVSIKDNGIGMEQKILEKVRNAVPYVTTKVSSTTSGFGAGVHMLRRFVEFHDGEINYDSEFEKGCTVTIRIPIANERIV